MKVKVAFPTIYLLLPLKNTNKSCHPSIGISCFLGWGPEVMPVSSLSLLEMKCWLSLILDSNLFFFFQTLPLFQKNVISVVYTLVACSTPVLLFNMYLIDIVGDVSCLLLGCMVRHLAAPHRREGLVGR